MDPVISAFVYIVIMILSAALKVTTKLQLITLAVFLEIVGNIQLAYFAGLWPFYLMAGFTVLIWILIIVMAAFSAREDARNA